MLSLLFLRFVFLQHAKHAPQTDVCGDREHQQPDNKLRNTADINVALAMAVENAVVTGVIAQADAAAVADIAVRRRDLMQRATAGRLRPEDVAGGTFTISNLGMYDVDAFTAIIVPPQAAILAVGAVVDRVVAVDGRAAVRPMMNVTLSCDHRVVDGARAAEFLRDLVTALHEAEAVKT